MSVLDRLSEPHRSAYKAAARGLLFPMGYSSPVARVSLDVIEGQRSFREAADEVACRHVASWTWVYYETGQLYGHGQMARDYDRALEQSRLYPNQFSNPDTSWHVIDFTPKLLEPTACDVVGTGRGGSPPDGFKAIRAHAGKFGLRIITPLNELHHLSAIEMPGSKRPYNENPSAYALKPWTNWPRLPEKFYVGAQPPPPPTGVTWDPGHHNYWWFPMDTNKPVLREGMSDSDPIGHILYAQFALRVAAYLQVKGGKPEASKVIEALGNPDGNFGPRTTRALTLFQQSRGLGADGVIGPKTWADLDAHIRLAQAGL